MSETEREVELLRGFELRLLRCTLAPPPSDSRPHYQPLDDNLPSHHLRSLINDLVVFIETGRYVQALAFSDPIQLVFRLSDSASLQPFDDSAECADRVYSELLGRVEMFLCHGEDEKDKAYRVILVLCIAVAVFLGFNQCNMTGPLDGLPKCPLPLTGNKGCDELVRWNDWARNQLMSAGSDLLGKLSNLQYIVFSKMLLMKIKDIVSEGSASSAYGISSISWWLARVILLQQRILDERSSCLFNLLQVFTRETLHYFGSLENVAGYWGANLLDEEGLKIVSVAHLEAGIMEYAYGRVDSCRLHFELAKMAAGLELSVTGALGFRTINQVDPKAQRVLIANTSSLKRDGNCLSHSCGPPTQDSDKDSYLSQQEKRDASDILVTPKLLANGCDSGITEKDIQVVGTAPPLSAIHQAIVLAQCLLIEKSARNDEMQRWDMAPYIEAIDSQQSSYFVIPKISSPIWK